MTEIDLREIASVRRMLSHTRGEGRSSTDKWNNRIPIQGQAFRRREREREIREEARQRVKNTQAQEMAKIMRERINGDSGSYQSFMHQFQSPIHMSNSPIREKTSAVSRNELDFQGSPPPPPSSPSCDSLDDVAIARCAHLLTPNNESPSQLESRSL